MAFIKDTVPVKSRVFITWGLILSNLMIMGIVLSMPLTDRASVFDAFGLVPARLFSHPFAFLTIFSSIFFHNGVLHFLFNMLYLWVFGDNIEGLLGSWRFLIFYLLGGVFAGLLHAVTQLHSSIPAIGSSGAVAAIMGAYILYFPHANIIFWSIRGQTKIPAQAFLAMWFVIQIYSGVGNMANPSYGSQTAWWAHIGGFIFGLLAAKAFAQGKQPPDPKKQANSNNQLPPWVK